MGTLLHASSPFCATRPMHAAHHAGRILPGKADEAHGFCFLQDSARCPACEETTHKIKSWRHRKVSRVYNWQESSRSCEGCVHSPGILSEDCRHGGHSSSHRMTLTSSCAEICFVFVLQVGISFYNVLLSHQLSLKFVAIGLKGLRNKLGNRGRLKARSDRG